jgi:Na+/melibiose symporter-like transporter
MWDNGPTLICYLAIYTQENQMATNSTTISTAALTVVLSVANKLRPDEWLAVGVFVGIIGTILSLLITAYVKFSMLNDARKAEQRRFDLLSKTITNTQSLELLREMVENKKP